MTAKKKHCPACGQTQKLEMYTSVNAEENPELRRDILRESVFDWECRHCGYTAQMAYPMIYHDPAHGFMVWENGVFSWKKLEDGSTYRQETL